MDNEDFNVSDVVPSNTSMEQDEMQKSLLTSETSENDENENVNKSKESGDDESSDERSVVINSTIAIQTHDECEELKTVHSNISRLLQNLNLKDHLISCINSMEAKIFGDIILDEEPEAIENENAEKQA